eukprot:1156016-Pyramimonas_sp.AAC.1
MLDEWSNNHRKIVPRLSFGLLWNIPPVEGQARLEACIRWTGSQGCEERHPHNTRQDVQRAGSRGLAPP